MKKIILTGERPTGPLHIGHYVGTLKSRVRIQNEGDYDEMYLFAADSQALTDNFDNPKKIKDNIFERGTDRYLTGGRRQQYYAWWCRSIEACNFDLKHPSLQE